MPEGIRRVRTEEVDWKNVLPIIRLFGSFRLAVHPSKLFLSLVLVILLYMAGQLVDAIWGPQAYADEVQNYINMPLDQFFTWVKPSVREEEIRSSLQTAVPELTDDSSTQKTAPTLDVRFNAAYDKIDSAYADQRQRALDRKDPSRTTESLNAELDTLRLARQGRLEAVRAIQPKGVFNTGLWYEVQAFERLVIAATSLNFGYGELLRGLPHDRTTVLGSLREMFIYVPGWLLRAHPSFLAVFCTVGLALWSLFGGALSRMSALHASRGLRISPTQGLRFAARRFHWFFLAYLLPALAGIVLIGVLWFLGFLFFGLPYIHVVTDIIGGIFFIVALLLGLAITLLGIGLLCTGSLLYPAVAVDDADAFDAASRAMSYIISRPWHLLVYNVAGLIYFGITYLFIVAVIFFSLSITQFFVASGADIILSNYNGNSRFEAMLPAPELGQLAYQVDWAELSLNSSIGGLSGRIAALLILVWVYLFIALIAAYAISYYFASHTWIYLLLRRSVDESEFDEIASPNEHEQDVDEEDAKPPAAVSLPDKIEPAPPK